MAAKRGKRRGRKAPKRRTRKKATHHISPMAHLARKVQGIDTRVAHIENEVTSVLPKRFVKRKRKSHRLGTLEERGPEYWGSGE
jgi:hypothetical protein